MIFRKSRPVVGSNLKRTRSWQPRGISYSSKFKAHGMYCPNCYKMLMMPRLQKSPLKLKMGIFLLHTTAKISARKILHPFVGLVIRTNACFVRLVFEVLALKVHSASGTRLNFARPA